MSCVPSNVFVMNKKYEIRKLNLSSEIIDLLVGEYATSVNSFTSSDFKLIDFKPNYTPNDDELLVINNYDISDLIINALSNSCSIPDFNIKNIDDFDIRCVFLGVIESHGLNKIITIAFKRFFKSFAITSERRNYLDLILGDDNTFRKVDSTILSIPMGFQVVYNNRRLIFSSYKIANEILDLTQYYRIASDQNIDDLVINNSHILSVKNRNIDLCNNTVRKLIAMIQDENVLTDHSVDEIIDNARIQKLNLDIIEDINGNKKIGLDFSNKDQTLNTLNFLAENTFVSTFSHETQITNSRRKLKQ